MAMQLFCLSVLSIVTNSVLPRSDHYARKGGRQEGDSRKGDQKRENAKLHGKLPFLKAKLRLEPKMAQACPEVKLWKASLSSPPRGLTV